MYKDTTICSVGNSDSKSIVPRTVYTRVSFHSHCSRLLQGCFQRPEIEFSLSSEGYTVRGDQELYVVKNINRARTIVARSNLDANYDPRPSRLAFARRNGSALRFFVNYYHAPTHVPVYLWTSDTPRTTYPSIVRV